MPAGVVSLEGDLENNLLIFPEGDVLVLVFVVQDHQPLVWRKFSSDNNYVRE